MAQARNDIVMDHVLSESWRLLDLLTVMTGIDVIFVGVHCSAADLAQRETARRDRAIGTAINQAAKVHLHGLYDLEMNTSAGDRRQ
jgi:chloramphenicol 3-O phosphotransferase